VKVWLQEAGGYVDRSSAVLVHDCVEYAPWAAGGILDEIQEYSDMGGDTARCSCCNKNVGLEKVAVVSTFYEVLCRDCEEDGKHLEHSTYYRVVAA
jgi:hypothetical protein